MTLNLIAAASLAGLTLSGLLLLQSGSRLVNWAGRVLLSLAIGLIVYAIRQDH